MGLYDAILEHTRKETEEFFEIYYKELAAIEPLVLLGLTVLGDRVVEGDFAKSKYLLDEAYKRSGSYLTDEDLDHLVENLFKLDKEHFDIVMYKDNEKFVSARKEWAKEVVEFYQELIEQEGKAESFEEAVRNQYETEDNYMLALEPIIEAERKICELLTELAPSQSKIYQKSLEITVNFREESARRLFS